MDDLISTAQAAAIIGVDESRVRQLIRSHDLPADRIGERSYAIRRVDAERFQRQPRGPRPKKRRKPLSR